MGKKRSLADANVDVAAPPAASKKPKTFADETSNSTELAATAAADIKKLKKEKKKNKKDKSEKGSELEVVTEQQAAQTTQSISSEKQPDEPQKKKKKSKKNKEPKANQAPTEEAQPEEVQLEVNGTSSTPKVADAVVNTVNQEAAEPERKKKKNKGGKEAAEAPVEKVQPEIKVNEPAPVEPEEQEAPESTKKSKKRRKKSKAAPTEPVKETGTEIQPTEDSEAYNTQQKTASRFICFIGNLPFSATKESIAKHFESVEPAAIRAPMTPDTNKSKGYAFLEFDRYDRMKSCLASYHHSKFDDGISPPRRINVELTVGGGGSKPARKEKLKAKNDKLSEERKRKHGASGEKDEEMKVEENDQNGMHPSRRARIGALQ